MKIQLLRALLAATASALLLLAVLAHLGTAVHTQSLRLAGCVVPINSLHTSYATLHTYADHHTSYAVLHTSTSNFILHLSYTIRVLPYCCCCCCCRCCDDSEDRPAKNDDDDDDDDDGPAPPPLLPLTPVPSPALLRRS